MKSVSRRRAREYAVQALYSWQLSQNNISEIEDFFLKEREMRDADIGYFRELLSGVAEDSMYLDSLVKPYICPTLRVGPVEKAVLRIALFELYKRNDVPYKVAINEAIELAKIFGSKDCHKFINSVLDKAALTIRPHKR